MTVLDGGPNGGCPDEGRLLAYLDDALNSSEARDLTSHVDDCAGCRERLRVLRRRSERVGGWIRRHDPPVPPAERLVPARRRPLRWAAAAVLLLAFGALSVPVAGWLADRLQSIGSDPVPTVAPVEPDGVEQLVTEFSVQGDELTVRLEEPAGVNAQLIMTRGGELDRAVLTVPDARVGLVVDPAGVELRRLGEVGGDVRLEVPTSVERVRIERGDRSAEIVAAPATAADTVRVRLGLGSGAG